MLLLRDDFQSYPLEELRTATLHEDLDFGPWMQETVDYAWHSGRIPQGYHTTATSWRVAKEKKGKILEQTEDFSNCVLVAGSSDWQDYSYSTVMRPRTKKGLSGMVFRYNDSRHYYFFGRCRDKVLVGKRDDEDFIPLLTVTKKLPERFLRFKVQVKGSLIDCWLQNQLLFQIDDPTYHRGKIGFRTDGPLQVRDAKVTASRHESMRVETLAKYRSRKLLQNRRIYPIPRLYKQIKGEQKFAAVRLVDLDNDGKVEILNVNHEVLRPEYLNIVSISAMNLEGKIIWTFGNSGRAKGKRGGDLPFQVGDIDGDGKKEVIFCSDFKIKIIDAESGELKNECPTPFSIKGTEDAYERIVGDSIIVCNLSGGKLSKEFIVKDRYCNLWAYDSNLRNLWHVRCNTGHFPRNYDINGDGKDEIMSGYILLDANGREIWSIPGFEKIINSDELSDHADSIIIGRFHDDPKGRVEIAMAAGFEGFILLDSEGNILHRERIGHAQTLIAAKLRQGLSGIQFCTCNLWRDPGIITVFDNGGRRLMSFSLGTHVALRPINWSGGQEELLLTTTYRGPAIYDSFGREIYLITKKKGQFVIVQDICEDSRDEIILGDPERIEVYTQDGSFKGRELYQPVREAVNFSGYGGFYSFPPALAS